MLIVRLSVCCKMKAWDETDELILNLFTPALVELLI